MILEVLSHALENLDKVIYVYCFVVSKLGKDTLRIENGESVNVQLGNDRAEISFTELARFYSLQSLKKVADIQFPKLKKEFELEEKLL
jgi:hypothetical protein